MEEQVLELLEQGAAMTEQIAGNVPAGAGDVRPVLQSLHEQGLIEPAAVTQYGDDLSTASAHWRLTDAGRARLEQLRSESA